MFADAQKIKIAAPDLFLILKELSLYFIFYELIYLFIKIFGIKWF